MRAIFRKTKKGTSLILSQTPPTRFVLQAVMRPMYYQLRYVAVANMELWGRQFDVAWESISIDKKLVWIIFINHTIALITLLELFLLR